MIKGVVAGNFDIIHPGYIKMFNEAKLHCDCLVVLLHDDPTLERPEKLKPILSLEERKEQLNALGVCDIISYNYEEVLLDLLTIGEFDIRFLGDDYKNKPFTGDDLPPEVIYTTRSHEWSTTKIKDLITLQTIRQNPDIVKEV